MCGIVGYFDCRRERPPDPAILARMTRALSHRGPDSESVFTGNHAGLGFRRLSIIDLNTGGQPHFSEDRSIVSVCNGEIFNYRELRSRLREKGHVFTSENDCEVLPHAYEELGDRLVEELNGQFAFAIVDTAQDRLLVARDHFGICPLYYTLVDGIFLCASEIKSLLLHPGVSREVDIAALDQLFCLPSIPSPRTIFRHIRSLKAGHYLVADHNGVRTKEYWDLEYPAAGEERDGHPEQHYIDRLNEHLERSVKLRLQADVPVGVYLSGGLDSAVTASLSARLKADDRLHSFSIRFADRELCEGPYQQIMADHIGSIHHSAQFDDADILKLLPSVIWHAEQPLKETYDAASMSLSASVRAEGMRVVLTGEGSDELFAGYLGYKFDQFRSANGAARISGEEQRFRERLWGDAGLFYERDLCAFRRTLTALYSPAVAAELAGPSDWTNHNIVNHDRIRGRSRLHQRSYLDFKLRLADHLVSDHGDRMAMANSVEARYPFLDRELVEFVAQAPSSLKLKGSTEKYILKHAARALVPDRIVQREKFAFVAPGSPRLLGGKSPLIEELLNPARLRRQGFFNPVGVENLRRKYLQPGFALNSPYEDDLLIVVLTFGLCLETFRMPDFA